MDLGLIIYALNLSAIYALMAIGISILWSSVGMINMAHGASSPSPAMLPGWSQGR